MNRYENTSKKWRFWHCFWRSVDALVPPHLWFWTSFWRGVFHHPWSFPRHDICILHPWASWIFPLDVRAIWNPDSQSNFPSWSHGQSDKKKRQFRQLRDRPCITSKRPIIALGPSFQPSQDTSNRKKRQEFLLGQGHWYFLWTRNAWRQSWRLCPDRTLNTKWWWGIWSGRYCGKLVELLFCNIWNLSSGKPRWLVTRLTCMRKTKAEKMRA